LLPTLYGVLLATPAHLLIHHRHAPAVLARLADLCEGRAAGWGVPVAGAPEAEQPDCCFDPTQLTPTPPRLPLPQVLVVGPTASALTAVAAETHETPAGFIRHPESPEDFPAEEELAALRTLGRPFWLSGHPATPEQFHAARQAGAAGLVVGTPFYYCAESELAAEWKQRVFEGAETDASAQGPARLDVEFVPSPTGFSVPVVKLEGTVGDPEQFARRERFCDVGFLRQLYRREDGSVGYRCPGETLASHLAKGGDPTRAQAQPCMCNGLLAALGLGQIRPGQGGEPPLLPAGEDLRALERFRSRAAEAFTAADVVATLLEEAPEEAHARDHQTPREGAPRLNAD
jgi:nitronate monooxygenase